MVFLLPSPQLPQLSHGAEPQFLLAFDKSAVTHLPGSAPGRCSRRRDGVRSGYKASLLHATLAHCQRFIAVGSKCP